MKKIVNDNPFSETFPAIDPYETVKASLLFQYELSPRISRAFLPTGMVYDHAILEPKLNFEDTDEIPF